MPMVGAWNLCDSLEPTVIIAVIAVRMVQVIPDEIVNVPGVRHALMAASRTVDVACRMPVTTMIGRAL
jgi:hypothetical protein